MSWCDCYPAVLAILLISATLARCGSWVILYILLLLVSLFENHTDFTFVVLAIPLIFALLSTGGRWVIFFVVGSQFHSEIIQISLNSSLTPSFFPVLATLATGGRWVIILMKLIKISFKQDLLRLKTSCNFIFALLTTLLFCAIESEIRTSYMNMNVWTCCV